MRLRTSMVLLALGLSAWSTAAIAQFPGFPGHGSRPKMYQPETPPSDQSDAPSLGGAPSAEISSSGLVQAYVAAQSDLNEARLHLANAFGLKELALQLEFERRALGSGSTLNKDDLQRQTKLSEQADLAIAERIEREQRLSQEGKEHYRASLEPYGRGMLKAAKLPLAAQRFVQETQSKVTSRSVEGIMSLGGSARAATFVAKNISPFLKQARKTFKQVTSYGKKLDIEIPADATEALASLDDEHFASGPEETEPSGFEVAAVEPAQLVEDEYPAGETISSPAATPTPMQEAPGASAWAEAEPREAEAVAGLSPATTARTASSPLAADLSFDDGSRDQEQSRGLMRDWAQPKLASAPASPPSPEARSQRPVSASLPGTALWEPWTESYHLAADCPLIFKKGLRKMGVAEADGRGLTPCRRCARPAQPQQQR